MDRRLLLQHHVHLFPQGERTAVPDMASFWSATSSCFAILCFMNLYLVLEAIYGTPPSMANLGRVLKALDS